jgi:hypothetical protein
LDTYLSTLALESHSTNCLNHTKNHLIVIVFVVFLTKVDAKRVLLLISPTLRQTEEEEEQLD